MPTVYTLFDDLGQMLKRKRGALPVIECDGKFPGIGLVVAPEASADGASPNGESKWRAGASRNAEGHISC